MAPDHLLKIQVAPDHLLHILLIQYFNIQYSTNKYKVMYYHKQNLMLFVYCTVIFELHKLNNVTFENFR